MKIKAELEPLDGKYYGSIIKLTNDSGATAKIQVWINAVGNYKPSKRELKDWDELEYGPFEVCDDHFESETAHKICNKIVEALNGVEV